MTIRKLLAEGRTLLSSGQSSSCIIDSPGLDAALLLGEVLHYSRDKLLANGGDEVSPDVCGQFQRLLRRRLEGECIAYILGRREFMGLDFTVTPQVLVPRPETEILVETALKAGDTAAQKLNIGIRLLDLCTGSGAAAISLKHERSDWEIWASDISAQALKIAKKNAERLLPNTQNLFFAESDLFAGIQGSFDLIISNPPYIASSEITRLPPEVRHEPALALDGGKDGLDIIRRIIADTPTYLKPDGRLILEADPRQMETISAAFLSCGFSNVLITKDLSGYERIIGGNL